jgi:hypothetical protein
MTADRLPRRARRGRRRRRGVAGRTDPEAVVVEKLAIASELHRIARALDAA